ncbi:lytic transglycosylase domain-containing protein [Hydrogenophaga taeniospiralis]|uniref:lytic transglycosylase domain-containing protein n=1 Tax=Hydrogenophaga taeniospiralis TaxID=65656 RepID=UPI001CFB5A75|nr:transglycosylase SLT domain-containing protein [Hydrogenophaga taeniospiralis]
MRWRQTLLTLATLAGAVPAVGADTGIVVSLRTLGDHSPEMATDGGLALPQLLEQGQAAMGALDFHLAAQHYCSAARQGSVDGQYRLGRLLLQQRSVPKAQAQGRFMLALAAQNGHAEALQFFDEPGLVPMDGQRPQCLPEPAAGSLEDRTEPVSHEVVKRYLDQLNRERRRWAQRVQERAPYYGVDPRLAVSIVRAESNFNPFAVSPKNAQGLMQLIPATAKRFGVRNLLDPQQNIEGGLAYLRWLLLRFDHDVVKTSAAYNAGEGAVDRHQGVPPFPETQAYVARILGFYLATRHQPPPAPQGKAAPLKTDRSSPRG